MTTEGAVPPGIEVESGSPGFDVDPFLGSREPQVEGEGPPACGHTRLAIKRGAIFAITHTDGAIHPGCTCGQGVYTADTRHISGMTWRLAGRPLAPLDCNVDQNVFAASHYLNEAFDAFRPGTIHLESLRVLDGAVHETVTITNHNYLPVPCTLELDLRADFRDMFEVRGFAGVRPEGGRYALPWLEGDRAALRYIGADRMLRETRVHFAPAPDRMEPTRFVGTSETGVRAEFRLVLPPREAVQLTLTIQVCAAPARPGVSPASRAIASGSRQDAGAPRSVETGMPEVDVGEGEPPAVFGAPGSAGVSPAPRAIATTQHAQAAADMQQAALAEFASVSSSNPAFDRFLKRGTLDLLSLAVPTAQGPLFAAGVPWYSCPFGRDSLITAFQALPLNPEPAVGTLRYLAAHQGTRQDAVRDEEPGKILHESREGELSLSGQVPFAPSFCTVDATPLFLVLLSETYQWTGDLELVRELWPNALQALEWLDRFGDADGDGFVEYSKHGEKGLSNQGWKDSWDSVQHPDGALAEGPIALVEVQGYAYDAKMRMAGLADLLGEADLASRLRSQAAALREAFHAAYWDAESGYLALALDAGKRKVVSPTSNPGHCLWSGLLDDPIAQAVRDALLGPGLFSRWGIRTLSAESPNYNPVSYHNGSVWPHDNALIAHGLARYGFKREAASILEGLFATAQHFPLKRLPELFCGFPRDHALSHPVPYPVACSPQAWAAGTPIMLLRAILGLEADAAACVLRVVRPHLPAWAGEIRIEGMRVGSGRVSLAFRDEGGTTAVRVLAADGDLAVEVRP